MTKMATKAPAPTAPVAPAETVPADLEALKAEAEAEGKAAALINEGRALRVDH